ncbi:MAG: sugar O-acetyltransferase, partial [Hallerella porci]|nr:sugar O-acetyltransferase [Hallerella porci]
MIDNITRRDSGMAYFADESVTAQQLVAKKCIRKYNQMMPFDLEGLKCLDEAGIKHSGSLYFEPPFHCEYGTHIQVGDNFYANAFCVMLDVGKITIGDNVFFGPSVSVYTAGHPIH